MNKGVFRGCMESGFLEAESCKTFLGGGSLG